jgi:hypothetical protein
MVSSLATTVGRIGGAIAICEHVSVSGEVRAPFTAKNNRMPHGAQM